MPDEADRYKPLNVPEFKSAIPAHLLGKLTDQERYLVETLSKMEAEITWLIETTAQSHQAIIDNDRRAGRLERWRELLTSRWAIVAAVSGVCVPVLVKSLIDWLLKKSP